MRTILLVWILFASSSRADHSDPYGLARALAIKEKKNLVVYVDSDSPEEILERQIPDHIWVVVHQFDGAGEGDVVYSEYRQGGWLEWTMTMKLNGPVKYRSPNLLKSPQLKQSIQKSMGYCETGS